MAVGPLSLQRYVILALFITDVLHVYLGIQAECPAGQLNKFQRNTDGDFATHGLGEQGLVPPPQKVYAILPRF